MEHHHLLNQKTSPVKLEDEIKNKIKNKKENNYVYKFTSFYSIRSINQLESIKEGPQFYRVPKNNSVIKNEYEFDVIKYFNNTCVSPNNRTLLYIQLFSEFNEKNENDFIEKAKKITVNFVNKITSDMKEDILKNYNNEEFKNKCNFSRMKIKEEVDKIKEEEEKIKKEEEEKKKKEGNQEEVKKEGSQEEAKKEEKEEEKEKIEGAVYIPPKRPRTPPKIEEISLNPEIILKYEYNQKIEISDYFLENNENNIIFTKNNSLSNDLDEYFEESFNILQQNKLIKEEKEEDIKKEKEEVREVEDEDEIEDNNLIDELFNEIEMNEEKKEEKEEKKDEKKEEKTSENKEEEKKEEEKKEEEKKEIEKEGKEKKEEEKTSEQKEEDKKE